jgi:2,4-dienoyl-CoA reductase-like NADH-dependent reductase (Old Yellow Enzyme family)
MPHMATSSMNMSPLSNHRSDEYGGSFENWVRIVFEVMSAIREVWNKELTLFIRISASEWVQGVWTMEDSAKLHLLLRTMHAPNEFRALRLVFQQIP